MPFQLQNLVFEQQFFLLEALQLQLVLTRFFGQSGNNVIEIAVFEVQFGDPLLKRFDISLHGQPPRSDGMKSIALFFWKNEGSGKFSLVILKLPVCRDKLMFFLEFAIITSCG